MASDSSSSLESILTIAFLGSFVLSQFIPTEFEAKIRSFLVNTFRRKVCSDFTVVIPQYEWPSTNHMYKACDVYLSTRISDLTYAVRLTKSIFGGEEMTVAVDTDEIVKDIHGGIPFTWLRTHTSVGYRCFQLSFDRAHRDYALHVYLPHVWKKFLDIRAKAKKTVRLYTLTLDSYGKENRLNSWCSAVVNHPATIETMAMDPTVKEGLLRDLDLFVKRKDYYKRVGRAWKRGYLLYGPPGTGKSSLIAAMANYLKFDIFDLDLKAVKNNAHLRDLLLWVTDRSILVIEDIDCNAVTRTRVPESSTTTDSVDDKITLSGLLNLIDGLWSCTGEERIIIFTTNHKERLDPALLRPGRMDVQLEMSYCTFPAFKMLASNYLSMDNHPLFPEIEELLAKSPATPAQIAGELMKNHKDDEAALLSLICLLRDNGSITCDT